MVLRKINKFLYLFILRKIDQEKVFSNVLERKLASVEYKNIDFQRSQNFLFSKRLAMVLVKSLKYLDLFFLATVGWEKVFSNVLDRKLPFLDYKNLDLKKWQN